MNTINDQLPTNYCEGVETPLLNMVEALVVMSAAEYGADHDWNIAEELVDTAKLHRIGEAVVRRANEEASFESRVGGVSYGGALIAIASRMAAAAGAELAKTGGDEHGAVRRISR